MEDKTEKKEAKKPYTTPRLTKYGKVEQMTQGAHITSSPDVATLSA